jgi:hypothetical protein
MARLREVSKAPPPIVAPGVSRRNRVPAQLSKAMYYKAVFGADWWKHTLWIFLASLPGSHPQNFKKGAIWLASRLLQPPTDTPFLYTVEEDETLSGFRTSELGLVQVRICFSLHRSNAKLEQKFAEMLKDLRIIRSVPAVHCRPSDPAILQRDFVAFLLSEEKWSLPDIERQLAFMGCVSFPKTRDPKALIRQIRQRFRGFREQLQEESIRVAKEACEGMFVQALDAAADERKKNRRRTVRKVQTRPRRGPEPKNNSKPR